MFHFFGMEKRRIEISNKIDLHVEYDSDIKEIPLSFFSFKDSNYFYINFCSITIIPQEIGQLVNLISINFDNCKLTDLPKEIGNLINLTTLSICCNELIKLPKEIGKLRELKYIYAHGNRLTELPKEIGKLKNLQFLDIENNKIACLPDEVSHLQNVNLRVINNSMLVFPRILIQISRYVSTNCFESYLQSEVFLGNNFHPRITQCKRPEQINELIRNKKLRWTKNDHKHAILAVKKRILTLLILHLKDGHTKEPKYKECLIYILPKELILEILCYLPLY